MLSPIEFGPPPFELVLPPIDINQMGSVMITVWQLANQYSLLIIFFFLILGVSAIGWLYNFVTHRRSATIDLAELWKEE